MSLEKYKVNLTEEEEQVKTENGSVSRKEGIEKGILMQVVHLWIINPKTEKVIMQRRNKDKENDPYMIDVSCSGHIKATEIPEQSLLREAFEEMGVLPDLLFPNLQKLKQTQMDFTKVGRKGKYIVHEYLAFLEIPIQEYKINEEVEYLFEEDYKIVKRLIREENAEMRIPKNEQTEEILNSIDNAILQRKYLKQKEESER